MQLSERIARTVALFLGAACYVFATDAVFVTCGSAIKLRNEGTGYHLHSHTIKWGGGSGQQSITAHGSEDDQGSMWIVKEGNGAMPCEAGEPIKCGNAVRLEHVVTGKNLHSHAFKSPLSRGQEVSGFGDAGEGDGGDTWRVECARKGDEAWARDSTVKMRHVDTKKYLSTSMSNKFTQSNCPNCPIVGQLEVTCASGSGSTISWKADQGVYLGATS